MIAASQTLIALLTSGKFYRADLYTITPVCYGTAVAPIRWTSADIDVTVGGQVFSHGGVRITRDHLRLVAGLETDTVALTITVDPANEPLINGVPLRQAVQRGLFDGAQVQLDWCYLSNWTTPGGIVGSLTRFVGRAGEINIDRTGIKLGLKSWLALLDNPVPSQVYQASCRFSFGDSSCGAVARVVSGTVAASGPTTTVIPCALGITAGSFDGGWLQMTSGLCNGVRRAIRQSSPGQIMLTGPLPWTPSAGDGFNIYSGCDKLMPVKDASGNYVASPSSGCASYGTATCDPLSRFGGTPFIPVPETAV